MKYLSLPKVLYAFLICIVALNISAQEISYDKIDFQENPEWAKILRQAGNAEKIIFLDAYTSWCAPCKKMEREVFTKPEVANYFNQKFINVKYDMEQGEGVTLRKSYGVHVFPTYLFINGDGYVVHKIVGAHFEEGAFLKYSIKAATPGENYAGLKERYQKGERNSALMFDYLQALRLAGEPEAEEAIAKGYLALMGKDHFLDADYWEIIKYFLKDPLSKPFRILLENREEIAAVNGADEVDGLIIKIFDDQVEKNMSGYTKEGIHFDRDEEAEFIDLLKNTDFPYRDVLLAKSLMAHYHRRGKWQEFAFLMDAIIDFRLLKEHKSPLREIDHYTNKFINVILDEDLLEKALRWSEYTCKNENGQSDRAKFMNTKAAILEKLGRKQEADETRAAAARPHR